MEVAAKKPPEAWDFALLSSKSAAGAFMDQASQAKMVATVSDIYRDRAGLFPSTCHNGLDVASGPLLGNNSVLANQWRVWPNYLQQALKLPQPPRGCSELAQHCLFQPSQSHLAMAMVRALCPVTCGCNSLQRGTMFVAPEMGCPAVCLSGVPDAERDGPSECVDTDPSSNDPRVATALAFFAEGRRAHGVGKGRSVAEEDWRTIGCDVATSGQDICVGDTHSLVTRITADAATPLDYVKLLTFVCPVRCNCNGKRAGAAVPPGTVCPSVCICPWRIPQPISEFDAAPSCRLPNPYWGPGNFFPNVSTDARCCFLMQEWMDLVMPLNAAGSNFTRLSYQNRQRYMDMDQHICHRCRSTCLSTLVEFVAKATYQNNSFVRKWFCNFPE